MPGSHTKTTRAYHHKAAVLTSICFWKKKYKCRRQTTPVFDSGVVCNCGFVRDATLMQIDAMPALNSVGRTGFVFENCLDNSLDLREAYLSPIRLWESGQSRIPIIPIGNNSDELDLELELDVNVKLSVLYLASI